MQLGNRTRELRNQALPFKFLGEEDRLSEFFNVLSDDAPEEDKPKHKTRKRKKGGKKKHPRKLKIVIAAVIIPDESKTNQDLWDFIPAQYLIRSMVNKISNSQHNRTTLQLRLQKLLYWRSL